LASSRRKKRKAFHWVRIGGFRRPKAVCHHGQKRVDGRQIEERNYNVHGTSPWQAGAKAGMKGERLMEISMRAPVLLLITALAVAAPAARAGMRLTLVMIGQDQLTSLSHDEHALQRLLFNAGPDVRLTMDKEWGGIQFLLNGNPDSTEGPYGQVIFGGQEIGPDMGYGPARVVSAKQVAEIASHLQSLSAESLRQRYDPKAMTRMDIYPDIWERDGTEACDWLIQGYVRLVDFYVRAAARGSAVILAIL
jgi:uncharacterized protein DUF1877